MEADVTAGNSETPQARKLGIKAGQRVRLDRPPRGWALTDPPSDLDYVGPTKPADLIVSFFTAAEQLPRRLLDLVEKIYPAAPCGSPGPAEPQATTATSPTPSCDKTPLLWAWWM
jgi:hypothetical protein